LVAGILRHSSNLGSLSMDPVLEALADQQSETALLVHGLTEHDAESATRCTGWSVSDVLLHLAQSDELAIASLMGALGDSTVDGANGWSQGQSVDESVEAMVTRDRGAPFVDVLHRWTSNASGLREALAGMDLSVRVQWVAGELSARTLATTRLAETWIHTGDMADALGVELVPSDRLKLVARLAWRTLPYAFSLCGQSLSGPVELRLVGPSGELWEFTPDAPAATIISGSAVELCEVAARRLDPADTDLVSEGPDGENALALIRTYA
jgi:uncharacterized protein (TIGR03084 family)